MTSPASTATRCASWLAGLLEPARRNLAFYQQRRVFIATVGVIGFPLYWYVWTYLYPQPYENIGLRLVGTLLYGALAIPPDKLGPLRRFHGLRWYVTILYGLPFFFTFMMLKNAGNAAWMESLLIAIFVMVILLDALMLVVISCTGMLVAWVAYRYTTEQPQTILMYGQQAWLAGFAVVLGTVANMANERIRAEQERAMLSTASSIAHELRTPLLSIKAGAGGLQQHLPTLLDAYQQAKDAGIPVTPIRGAHLDGLKGVLDRIDREADYSNTVIDMLMANTKGAAGRVNPESRCHIRQCLEVALHRYPFSRGERELITVIGDDFVCHGEELLLVHVFFNLIKNSLRHIAQRRQGEILVTLSSAKNQHVLSFRDTGTGIAPSVLPHIFERFYSGNTDPNVMGTGIGLAFCRDVMRRYGGEIDCKSELNAWTEFRLYFPLV